MKAPPRIDAPAPRLSRGVTLLEVSVSLAVLAILMAGVMAFLVTQGKMGFGAIDRTEIQRGGRAALTLMEEKIGMAGLGLPRHLAIKSFSTSETCGAATNFPKLEVAYVDYLRQWTATGTNTGALTLSAISTSSTPPNPNPNKADGSTSDVAFGANQWLFLYRSVAPGGFGMAKITAARAAGDTGVTLGATNYSAAQSSLDLANTSPLNDAAGGRPLLALFADVSGFGVDCAADTNHPYLYWEHGAGVRTPIASNISTPSLGGPVGLAFKFYLDTDGDGLANGSPVTSLTFNSDLDTATNDDVVAIEVSVRLRSDRPDPASGAYRSEWFTRRIQLANVHTQTRQYVFIDNTGI
jgi:prepilin-type N-terminal cleavage/methylation domain-containing protein